MKSETVVVVVARALVEEDVDLRPEPTPSLEVRVGQPITLTFVYHLNESSAMKDAWRLRLRTRYGKRERVMATEHHDTPLVKDRVWATVEATYTFQEAGSATVHFDAEACNERTAWVGGKAPVAYCKSVRGSVAIMVLP